MKGFRQLRAGARGRKGTQGLGEREGKENDGEVPAGQVSGELAAQQMRVAAGQQQPIPLALQAIHEELPLRQVLDLVEQQMTGIPVHRVDRGQEPVVVLHLDEAFIVEVEVAAGGGLR